MLDADACYAALRSRDKRFDGHFFVGVRSTGVYCRPVCPARTPRRDRVAFYRTAAEAHQAGFRACLRCRPETAPRSAAWIGTEATVRRALRLIEEGALDRGSVRELADRLGVSDRRLRALFRTHVGASPVAVGLSRRLRTARLLLSATDLPAAEIAALSGFGSTRRFNDAVQRGFGRSPTELRAHRASATLQVELRYRAPMCVDGLMAYFAARAMPGVERVQGGVWSHGIEGGVVRVSHRPDRDALRVELPSTAATQLPAVLDRIRRTFDVDADTEAIRAHLAPLPMPLGLRLPGAFDPFAVAVRIVLGQQVSVKGATTLAGRLTAALGLPPASLSPFPPADVVARSPLDLGMPEMRIGALRALARAVADGAVVLSGAAPHDEVVRSLVALPGIGPWTAQMISLRACGEPDAFPDRDLILARALAELPAGVAEQWRPWRAYAAMTLWRTSVES